VVVLQAGTQLLRHRTRQLVGEVLGQGVERLDEHLRVEGARQAAAGHAEGGVLAVVGLLAERVAGEAQARRRLSRLRVRGRRRRACASTPPSSCSWA